MLFANIQAFLSVATFGSFNKAADDQKVSATAIMKRLNNLENELNVKLLIRDNSGVKLTEAGKAFYNDTKLLATYIEQCKERVKRINSMPHSLRIGASPISPTNIFFDIWPFINKLNPNINLEIVACRKVIESHLTTLQDENLSLDAMLGVFDKDYLLKEGFKGIELCKLPFYISAPSCKHKLALKTNLTYADFKNQDIYVIKRFICKSTTSLLQNFTDAGANLKIFSGYDVDLIDELEKTNSLVLCFSNVKRINPNFIILDINLNESISFGIIYENVKSIGLKHFIEAFKQYKNSIANH